MINIPQNFRSGLASSLEKLVASMACRAAAKVESILDSSVKSVTKALSVALGKRGKLCAVARSSISGFDESKLDEVATQLQNCLSVSNMSTVKVEVAKWPLLSSLGGLSGSNVVIPLAKIMPMMADKRSPKDVGFGRLASLVTRATTMSSLVADLGGSSSEGSIVEWDLADKVRGHCVRRAGGTRRVHFGDHHGGHHSRFGKGSRYEVEAQGS